LEAVEKGLSLRWNGHGACHFANKDKGGQREDSQGTPIIERA
jgi:hypothetical protein